jgi:hypothetical protein
LKLGFDRPYNPIIQFGGLLSAPNSKYGANDRSSFAAKMDSEWMLHKSDWVFKGDRFVGTE